MGLEQIIVPVLAAAATALVGWLAIIRQFSGKISSSAAEQLWNESRSIREFQAEAARRTQRIIDELRAEIRRCTVRNADLEAIIVEMRTKIAHLEAELEGLK